MGGKWDDIRNMNVLRALVEGSNADDDGVVGRIVRILVATHILWTFTRLAYARSGNPQQGDRQRGFDSAWEWGVAGQKVKYLVCRCVGPCKV